MGKSINWNYTPYKPFFFETGDIYICRVAPGKSYIHFEWLSIDAPEYEIYFRERDKGEFSLYKKCTETECDIENLADETDYEFYVSCGDKKSRIRLARTGEVVGTVVNYLHPDDKAYSFSGNYICSPSILRHPSGTLFTSMDIFGHSTPQNLTLIFRSDDDGKTWHYVTELMPCFWAKLFLHKGDIYVLSCSTEYGDLLIGKTSDCGKTFEAPTVLLRGGCKTNCDGIHKNPQNVVKYKGRIYETLEWGSWHNYYHAVMVMSCDENADLLDASNWSITPPVKYNPDWEGVAVGNSAGNIEGTLVVAPNGKLYNIMRYDTTQTDIKYGKILAYEVDDKNPDAPLKYSHAIDFPANLSKFMIKKDEVSGKYITLATRITEPEKFTARNLLTLMVSDDLEHWEVAEDIIDKRNEDHQKVGLQYVDFEIEGDDIIFLCRTAMNNANDYHNTNYQTFHKIKDFRKLIK